MEEIIAPGAAPAVNLSSTSLVFATRKVGTTSPAQTVLENVGNLALTIGSVTAISDFNVVNNNCPASLGAGLPAPSA